MPTHHSPSAIDDSAAAAGAAGRWRVLVTPPADGAYNMALDDAMMALAVREDAWLLRIYGWSRPTISFGRNQAAARHYDRDAIDRAGFDVVRRPTGGRAILHHREITYSVAAPTTVGALSTSYAEINRVLAGALQRLGVPASVSTEARAVKPGPTPCFDVPSPGELIAGGRKLVGSAQWRSGDAFLQHGSILVDDDQSLLTTVLVAPGPPPPAAATLRAFLPEPPSLEAMAAALSGVLRDRVDDVTPFAHDESLHAAVADRLALYRSADWTWRR
jgi:lipoate-protein ligase A